MLYQLSFVPSPERLSGETLVTRLEANCMTRDDFTSRLLLNEIKPSMDSGKDTYWGRELAFNLTLQELSVEKSWFPLDLKCLPEALRVGT